MGRRLEGRTAIVTGAARGMGRAVAIRLAAEGANVVVNDLMDAGVAAVVAEIEAAGGRGMAAVADVVDYTQVQAMVDAAVARFGAVDILVNNAGILRSTKPLETIPEDEWDLMMAVNVKGVFNCTRAVLPLMKARRSGKILNVSSSAGRCVSTFGGAHYTVSKAAVLGLTRATASECARYGINVNATAPGSMDTEMVRELAPRDVIERATTSCPLGRLGTPEDEANLVAFLVSDEASYITGACVDLNGGDLMM